jgi:hypothetical protein
MSGQVMTAQLGISIEPISFLQGLAAAADTEGNSVPTFVDFSQKMVENLFNFASSFALRCVYICGILRAFFVENAGWVEINLSDICQHQYRHLHKPLA